MTPAPISRRTLAAVIEALPLMHLNPAMAIEAKAALLAWRAALDRPAQIRFAPHPTDDATWLIDGYPYRAPRGSMVPWAFYMALRDGEAQAEWVSPPGTVRNARKWLPAWLEQIGYQELATELRRVTIGRDGRMTYRRKRDAIALVFD